jgi:hypothetical protein
MLVCLSAGTAAGQEKGEGQEADVAALMKGLKSRDVKVRQQSVEALANLGTQAKPAVPALIQALRDRDGLIRYLAVQALVNIGPEAKAPLQDTIKVADPTTRYYASAALRQLGAGKGAAKVTNGRLTKKDALDTVRKDCRAKVHLIAMKAGKTYTIDMKSRQFDCYLRLESPEGTRLAEDDDSGGNLDARLSFTPQQDGMYRIIATTYGAGMVGNYQLIITASE